MLQRVVMNLASPGVGMFERFGSGIFVYCRTARCRFLDNDSLPDYYRSADLYVSASHSDGSSVSLLEAMACGVPPLVSDIPGNMEWVTHGRTGWAFADGDVEGLTEGILKAVRNKDNLNSMGLAAREVVEARADWTKNYPKMIEAYQMAIEYSNRGVM